MEQFIGTLITWMKSVDSTNDELARRISSGAVPCHGQVIAAREQTNGKGLAANSWESEPGKNLTFSLFLQSPPLAADQQFYLNMFVSLGVYHFVKSVLQNTTVTIKWPNDVYAGNGKIAGILIRHAISRNDLLYSIIGIGLNVNQINFSPGLPNPISLKQVSGRTYEPEQVLEKLLATLNLAYQPILEKDYEGLKKDYKNALLGYLQWLSFRYEGEIIRARITGVAESGLLQLETSGGRLLECDLKMIKFII